MCANEDFIPLPYSKPKTVPPPAVMNEKFASPDWQPLFDDLLFDLRRKACVLLIGPEIVATGQQPLQQALRQALERDHAADIEHYYEKEALFLFKDPAAKSKVQRGVSKFYDRVTADPAVFDTIAGIPFPLVVSTNPDDFLQKAYQRAQQRCATAYFNHDAGQNGFKDLAGWEGDYPLVYNLCGSTERDASLILDYDDLFSFLKNVLGATGLPDPLRSALKKAKSFLFVGFSFDKWYTQLLLRLLNEDSTPTQIALNTRLGGKEAQHFLLNRFKMQFLGRALDADAASPTDKPDISALEFLAELSRRWQVAQTERGETQQASPDTVRRLVEQGKVDKALAMLFQITADPEDRDMVTMLSSWYHNWERDKEIGAEDSRTLDNRYNKVLNGILEQLKSLAP